MKSLDEFLKYDSRTFLEFVEEERGHCGYIFGDNNINYNKDENETKHGKLINKVFIEIQNKL